MRQTTERRRKPRRRTVLVTGAVWVSLQQDAPGASEISAKLVDSNEHGIGIESPEPLRAGTGYFVKSDISDVVPNGRTRARVARNTPLPGGRYRVGLVFEHEQAAGPVQEVADYYEILQVNAKADPETIHRVYRLLAQRYHPDNSETGNDETFRVILEAYRVLTDPEKRAAYDVQLQNYRQGRWRVFERGQAITGKQAEKSKRRSILDLLYTARVNQPTAASVSLHELEDLLGCPREHLEFSLWYLKENGLVSRSDNGRFAITAKGVDHAEADEAASGAASRRMLSSG